MRYWWVNQNQTYAHEVYGGYLWSPKRNKNGAKNIFYENMTRVEPGDVVFSFCDTFIKAIGVACGKARSSVKPTEFGRVGSNWGNEGWYVPVEYTELGSPIRPKNHIETLRPTLSQKYSPLQSNGNGNQGVYLAELQEATALILRDLLGVQVEAAIARSKPNLVEKLADDIETSIESRQDIAETEKQQLIMARRGQGVFRERLESIEKYCRVTKVSQKDHLRASHLKPWRDSTDVEKLDGNNGLLLSPHIDHLVDRGFLSFADSGDILVSPKLDPSVLESWRIDIDHHVGPFNQEQQKYLAFHRKHIFISSEE